MSRETEHKKGCLICGKDLVYGSTEKLECFYCHKQYEANTKCVQGHFVCDACHSDPASNLIEIYCTTTLSEDPLELALDLMKSPLIKMHGPEHHFLIPAVLLAAYYNAKKDFEKKRFKIREARARAANVLGGFCGLYGDCGAAVGTGIFIALVTNSTPLAKEEWKLSNTMTAKSLLLIAAHGGPRCCKRNTFLAISKAVAFVKENLGVDLKINRKVRCEFTDINKECTKEKCPYYPQN